MVALTFPDGARRDYPAGTTGLDVAKGISPSLAKRTVGKGQRDHECLLWLTPANERR